MKKLTSDFFRGVLAIPAFILFLGAGSNTLERAKHDPLVDDPRMPGVRVPLSKVNPAPSPTPGEGESDKFRGTLLKKRMPSQESNKNEGKGKTTTGKGIMGPPTMGHPSYPSSGLLRNRSNDMTGKDMSNATLMGSDVDPRVPSKKPAMRMGVQRQSQEDGPQKIRDVYPIGPYQDGGIIYQEKTP